MDSGDNCTGKETGLKPDVSIILPVYNEAVSLQRSIDIIISYLETLNQEFEIVLVNDGSTDGSHEICKQLSRENSQV